MSTASVFAYSPFKLTRNSSKSNKIIVSKVEPQSKKKKTTHPIEISTDSQHHSRAKKNVPESTVAITRGYWTIFKLINIWRRTLREKFADTVVSFIYLTGNYFTNRAEKSPTLSWIIE